MPAASALDPRSALMLLSSMVEPGDADLDDLIAEAGPVEAVTRIWEGDVGDRLRRITAAAVAAIRLPAERAAQIAAATRECGARVLVPGDPQWPAQPEDLRLICDDDEPHLRPPRCLWVRGEGDLGALTERAVAIVGSRAATEYGLHVADGLAADLAAAGWTVVSGGAQGVDRTAHLGALARDGATVAVLASGLDLAFPRANHALFDCIARSGLLVSEWPPGTAAMKHRFLTRNRLVASLTAGTIVVESGARSGSLNTARLAHELRRTLMFTPGPVTSSMSAGVHQLARKPWGARLVTSAEEVIADLNRPIPARVAACRPRAFADLTETEQCLIESLPRGYLVAADRLAAAADVPAATTDDLLDHLHHEGWVERVDARWRLARNPPAVAANPTGAPPTTDSPDAEAGR
jgi:DNA processing protein